jgi:predicted TIM-barrel fold metal-dependent hydrolase
MHRIDVHQHLLPRVYLDTLDALGADGPDGVGWSSSALPSWSPRGALAMMDTHSIGTGVLSLSAPGTHFGDDAAARELATRVNDLHAELVKDRPDRFGMFAAVPLPDVDGALDAIAHADDDLHADGVVLLANHRGTYLGDPAFEPVFAELDRRRLVVFVHPAELPGPGVPGLTAALADFLLDTTRAALNLVLHRVPERYPNLTMILSHAGGFVPYAADRFAELAGAGPLFASGLSGEEILKGLRGFHFDTALSAGRSALPSLLEFAEPGHVHFGSDFPYVDDAGVGRFTGTFEAYDMDPATRASIDRTGAEALFPRLGPA